MLFAAMEGDSRPEALPIRAAGGLLWRTTPEGRRLAVVHRSRYGDWTLPKGKVEPGERPEETAAREVREETGCAVRVLGRAGETRYAVKGRPKVVTFFEMEHTGTAGELDPAEVDEVAWLSVPEALERLDYPAEADLVRRAARRNEKERDEPSGG